MYILNQTWQVLYQLVSMLCLAMYAAKDSSKFDCLLSIVEFILNASNWKVKSLPSSELPAMYVLK